MIINWQEVEVYIKPGPTDMRKQINGLSILVEDEFGDAVFSGNIFIFCNRNRKRLKIIYWDRTGFCLWLKRLEKHRFPWPRDEAELKKITVNQLRMLLEGIDFFNAHKNLKYSSVS